jgi:hypothetical protein
MDETSPAHRDSSGNPMVSTITPASLSVIGITGLIGGIEAHSAAESTISGAQKAGAAELLLNCFMKTFNGSLNDRAIELIKRGQGEQHEKERN